MKKQFTPDSITQLQSNEIFVFGSNLNGNHAGGAARLAVEKFGAINGQAEGLQGQSYAIPTLDEEMKKVSIDKLIESLQKFRIFISNNEDKVFYMTKIGCGIAGFDEVEISRHFQSIKWPKNVIVPRLFADGKLTDFIIKLRSNNIEYRLEDDKIIISGGDVDLSLLTTLPEGTQFNNGGDVYLRSLTTLPEGTQFNNGGDVYLRSTKKQIRTSYLKRFNVEVKENKAIIYKRVSKDYKTQEGQPYETNWNIGTTLTHPKWNPEKEECGAGKYHACAKPSWCDKFRSKRGDKYIAIEVHIKDLFEWKDGPSYPQKIAFRECKVLFECNRTGKKLS